MMIIMPMRKRITSRLANSMRCAMSRSPDASNTAMPVSAKARRKGQYNRVPTIKLTKTATESTWLPLRPLIAAMSGLNGSQVLSVAVFVSFIVGTLLYWPFRLAFALTGIAVLLASGLLDIAHLIEFASLDVILFLIGMMIIIGYLENNHFFEAALEKILP